MLVNEAGALYPFGRQRHMSGEGLEEKSRMAEPKARDIFGLPNDLRGWVLAAGSVGAVLVGIGLLLTGDPFGLPYLATGVAAYLFLHARVFSLILWSGVALGALAGAILGGSVTVLLVVLAGAGLALVAASPGADRRAVISDGTAPTDADEARALLKQRTQLPTAAAIGPNEAAGRGTVIRSIGRLQVLHDGEDVSAELLQRPTLAFLWSFLLARSVLSDRPLLRNSLADEFSPGLPTQSQTKRLRDQIYNLQHDVAPVIGEMVQADRNHVRFCLNGADFDVFHLRALSQSLHPDPELLDQQATEGAEAFLLKLPAGEFLAGFEELENAVTEGRGAASDMVRDARLQVAGWRGALACAVADHRLARRQPELALRVLEPALAEAPKREAIARRLIDAYLQSGQTARAEELRRQIGSKGEVRE
ncbi:MAG: tetratricopeptide repeat protein [Candidatus Dormibacteraeota bacterium]|uniref:Tetratricopeptide repeat protein n=1 Tax=Candidatus Dormiibacter inghamiae TaxID=3127013 RepID=A0A934NG54_9BACT|nr:tetratricopeptide repeat protein [Candidatus Dormibacteraeota bacterium]MBJ7607755.1 tetratricopeptide repeat protein [Candidatus Dormibacteraeota bacterium]